MIAKTFIRSVIAVLFFMLSGFFPDFAYGMDDDDQYGPQPTGAEQAAIWTADMEQTHRGDEDVLVLPGVVAHRKKQEVRVLAESTGLPSGDTPEFILIDMGSSHGYEAIFWSMAKPSDVHKALVFIGLEPGGGMNPAALRFWAQGDPVTVLIEIPDGQPFPVENTIFDMQSGNALEEEGFVFTGSLPVTLPDTGDKQHYAADVYDPRSILPLFNDPGSVLDVPRQAHQGEVYGRYAVNPDYPLDHGQMLTILMQPASQGERPARLTYRLRVTATNESRDLVFDLRTGDNDLSVMASTELTPVLERMVEKEEERQVIQVTLDFGQTIPIGGLEKLCRLLAVMETFNQIRIEPPLDGQLYYRSFIPIPAWANPEGRPSQPWELHIGTDEGGAPRVELVLHEPLPVEGSQEPVFEKKVQFVDGPDALRSRILADALRRELDGRSQLPAVILVFSDPELAHGTLMEYVGPMLDLYGTVYVFIEPPELVIDLEGDE